MGWFSDIVDPGGFFSGDFSPGQGLESIFNPGGPLLDDMGVTPDWLSNAQDGAANFVDDNVDVLGSQLEDFGNKFKKNPAQLLFGAGDPLSTKAWNGITGQNETPYVDQFGGMTPESWKNASNRGLNTENAGYMSTLAHAVAGTMAGNWAGGAAGSSLGVGSEAGAGSSALSDASGATSGGGFGSSQAAYDASQIPGWAAGGGGAYGAGVRGGASGAVQGAGGALDNDTNPFMGALSGFGTGATTGAMSTSFDPAGYAGVDDPRLKGAINGGIRGAATAGVSGGKMDIGAIMGALRGIGSGFNSTQDNPGYSQTTGGQGPDYGNIAAGLGQLYLGSKANHGINGQINNLNSLYAPNSPYAQQLQQSLARQDAAGGRRSQYGTRAVELQARLADAASRQAPTLSNLYQQQRQNRFGTAAAALQLGRSSGLLNPNLYKNMWQDQGQGTQMNDSLGQYQFPAGQVDSDVNATIPDLSSIYGG
jgi:hypothetical protein